MAMSSELLTSLLKDVSRSFYLTMRILPAAIRPQISLAYLLARASDTIADTEVIPMESRRLSLAELRRRIMGESAARLDFGRLAQSQALPAEKILLERCEEALQVLAGFAVADQQRIREVLDIIISGQDLDLRRFAMAGAQQITALETDAELDDYTYRVAGCVGEFWTRTCRASLFPNAHLDDDVLLQNAVRFGKGLQLVNILRDLPVDLRKGRCYLPTQELAKAGLSPADLLLPANEPRFNALYQRYLARAEAHLAAGWNYTNSLPRSEVRVRLACAWPILIGIRTLRKLHKENILDPTQRIKVSRADIRSLIVRSIFLYPFPSAWKNQFTRG
jgi:farnesyl-diphosphate farnesyltransferase